MNTHKINHSQHKTSERGAVSALIAIMLPLLVGLVALGIDSALIFTAHSRLQAATDSAALAASLELPFDPYLTGGQVSGAATDFLARNYPDAVLKSVAPGTETRSVTVNTEAEVPLLLMGVLGLSEQTIKASATAGFNNLEVVFVIDNSGSMRGTPINEANAAATELVELMIPDGMKTSIKAGLVPFRGKVHLPAGVDGQGDGCRNADGTVSPDLHPEYYKQQYRDPYYYSLKVSMTTCDAIPRVQGLSQDKSPIISAIEEQEAQGSGSGTIISEGIKWGREVLTPEYPFTEGSADPDMRKVMILLTDGDTEDGTCGGTYQARYTPNNYWTNAYYGMLDMDSHCEDGGKLNQAVRDEAAKAKAAGIEIFTIRFGVSDSTDIQLMKDIASSKDGTEDHYFDAPSAYDFDKIFKLIGRQLGWRLLS